MIFNNILKVSDAVKQDYDDRRAQAALDAIHYNQMMALIKQGDLSAAQIRDKILDHIRPRFEAFHKKGIHFMDMENNGSKDRKWGLFPSDTPSTGYNKIEQEEKYQFDTSFLYSGLEWASAGLTSDEKTMMQRLIVGNAVGESGISNYIWIYSIIEYGMVTINPRQDDQHCGYDNLIYPNAMISAAMVRFAASIKQYLPLCTRADGTIHYDAHLLAVIHNYGRGNDPGNNLCKRAVAMLTESNPISPKTIAALIDPVTEARVKKTVAYYQSLKISEEDKQAKIQKFTKMEYGIMAEFKNRIAKVFGVSPWPSGTFKNSPAEKAKLVLSKLDAVGDGAAQDAPSAMGTPNAVVPGYPFNKYQRNDKHRFKCWI